MYIIRVVWFNILLIPSYKSSQREQQENIYPKTLENWYPKNRPGKLIICYVRQVDISYIVSLIYTNYNYYTRNPHKELQGIGFYNCEIYLIRPRETTRDHEMQLLRDKRK